MTPHRPALLLLAALALGCDAAGERVTFGAGVDAGPDVPDDVRFPFIEAGQIGRAHV